MWYYLATSEWSQISGCQHKRRFTLVQTYSGLSIQGQLHPWPSPSEFIPMSSETAWTSLYISNQARLEYFATIWDPHLEKDTQQLEAIQRRAARFVVHDFSRYSSAQSYLNYLKWTPLKDRRRDIRLTFIFKIVTGRVAVQAEGTLLPADSRTRHKYKHKYRHLPATCNQCLNSFFVKTIPDWNPLPEACITADTVTAFQSRLRCPP